MPNDKNLQRLAKLLEAFDSGAVQHDELIKAIEAVVAIINQEKERLSGLISETDTNTKQEIKNLTEGVIEANKAIEKMIADSNSLSQKELSQVRELVATEVSRLEESMPEMPDDFDASDIFEMLGNQSASLEALSALMLGENIRNALEAIPEEGEKLKIEAIGFLREELNSLKKVVKEGSQNTTAIIARSLSQLSDVVVDGATNGQVLAYNSTTKLWTPVDQTGGGGGGTGDMTKAVYDPNTVEGDAFAMDNMVEGADTKILTASERTKLSNTSGTNTGDQDLTPYALHAGDTYTGTHDFGGATDLELPNGTAPTVDTDGQVAIDTDITDMSHGLLKYYAGEEVVTVSMPVAQLSALNNGWLPAYNATADEFQMTAPASGSGDTYNVSVNTLTIDSTAGTGDTWGVLAGAVNGVNTTYTVSTGVYKSGTLKVFKNNLLLIQGTGEDWVETTPASGIFDFNTAPLSGDVITVEYSDQDTTANSLIVEKDTTTVSTNYTALITDRNINVNAASGDITITLPALEDIDSIGITIKKIDTSGNVVTIATPNSETIDGDSTDSVDEPLRAKTVYSDGTNYFNK